VCQKPYEVGGKTFVLTDEEKALMGDDAPDEVSYCSACVKVMEDRTSGAQLLKGLYEMQLREAGVTSGNARKMAQRFHGALTKAKGKPH
jgi:hypothetical protein